MVAMVIGLLGIIVMMQMFSLFEGQKRTTSGGDDAISSGAVSLYGIQRNIQQSGWGINSVKLIGCSVTGLLANAATSIPLVPLTIYRWNGAGIVTPTGFPTIPTPDPNTEVLLIMSGSGNGTVEGDVVNSGGTGQVYSVHTPSAFSAGPPKDRVIAVSQTWPPSCNLTLTTIASIDAAGGTVNVDAAAAFSVLPDDRLFNLGNSPTVRVYAVRNGNLTVCDFRASDCGANANKDDATIWVPIANNVVSMRAQYGRDTTAAAMDGAIDVWDRIVATATSVPPVSTTGTKNTASCGFIRVSAVRVALVARSSQPEKRLDGTLTSTAYVTPVIPLWAGSNPDLLINPDATESAAVAISLPDPRTDWPTWQDFRYKVFQTAIPLRNITTLGVVPEC